jgi:hypothetical protein
MFLVCFNYIFDIVIIDDDYMHMFVERLIQCSSGLSGAYYVSVVFRYYLPADALYMSGHVVDHGCDRPVESSVVHFPYVKQVEPSRKGREDSFSNPPKLMFPMLYSELVML